MKILYTFLFILLSSVTAVAQTTAEPAQPQAVQAAAISTVPIETGVSAQLAAYRRAVISNVQYMLQFNIPAQKSKSIKASEIINFNLSSNHEPLQLDFKQDTGRIKVLLVNENVVKINLQHEHLLIDTPYLHKGADSIAMNFVAGDQSLNRNDDYLYALFVPDHARTAFPCFDQPDLKARFALTLQAPTGWKVLANGTKKDSVVHGAQTTWHFNTSDKLSTYLFSFTAGKYSSAFKTISNYPAQFLYRETGSVKIKMSVDSVFAAHQNAISYLQWWTGIPFPFQKVGFVAIPDFQFGGMEHPGEVQYQASSQFLDSTATKDRLIARINLISHETAHMWFGDMVTMEWFNDVWMKEVFANFMADKVTEKLMGPETFNLKFLQDHYPAAYGVDRTEGANPIRQQLDNLQDAGSLYGNIIYHKAPIMMRQLELLMGKENFRLGVQEYLKKYAYGNATWNDLIAILSKHTKADLYAWNKVWVNQPGRPVFDYSINYQDDKISKFTLSQHPESGENRFWPQYFTIDMVYPDGTKKLQVNMAKDTIELKAAAGMAKPSYILFNSDGMGYGLLPVDKQITDSLFTLKSPPQRASAYVGAYENMLAGRYFKPDTLLQLFTAGAAKEKDEMNLRMLTGYMSSIYWEYTTPTGRKTATPVLEQTLWNALQQDSLANNKKILFRAYQDIALSRDAKARLHDIWQKQQPPAGLKLSEDDHTALALTLALKSDNTNNILQQQETRIQNPDRKKRLEFLMPALSADTAKRTAFFNSLKLRSNRAKEAWVVTALGYLNHPLRQSTSVKYLPESLNLVEEIQKTGDIFFPQSWLGAALSYYQSPEAAQIVRDFLSSHPDYNPKLRDKILQSADNLFRAQKLVIKENLY